jgi:hypothetical protein
MSLYIIYFDIYQGFLFRSLIFVVIEFDLNLIFDWIKNLMSFAIMKLTSNCISSKFSIKSTQQTTRFILILGSNFKAHKLCWPQNKCLIKTYEKENQLILKVCLRCVHFLLSIISFSFLNVFLSAFYYTVELNNSKFTFDLTLSLFLYFNHSFFLTLISVKVFQSKNTEFWNNYNMRANNN